MMNKQFIPYGYKPDHLSMVVLGRFSIEARELVVTEYGFMIGVFDFLTGGKIADISINDHIGHTQGEYIAAIIKKAEATIKFNPGWLAVLNRLPVINTK